MKTLKLLFAGALLAGTGLGQTTPQSLLVTRLYNIQSGVTLECGAAALDNRSQYTRQNNYHSFTATGTGTWSVTMQYSDTACTGPWTSFGAQAVVDQASNPAIGYGNGYHAYIRFAFAGAGAASVRVTYSASKDYFLSTSVGAISFPCSVAQGCTGATSVPAAKVALNIFTPADIRYYGATCDGSDQNTAVQAAITAGHRVIGIPAGCKWQLPLTGGLYLVPGNITYVGEGNTSIVTVPDPTIQDLYVAPNAVLKNMNIKGAGCTSGTGVPGTGGDCLVGEHFNYTAVNEVYRSTGYTALQGAVHAAGDYAAINIGTRGTGDGVFCANEDHLTYGGGGPGNGGAVCFRGWQQDSAGGAALFHMEKQNSGLALLIKDSATANANLGTDAQFFYTYKTSGDSINWAQQGAATYSGSLMSASMGQGASTFTGPFINFYNEGAAKFVVDSGGNVTTPAVVDAGAYKTGGYSLNLPPALVSTNYAFAAQAPATSLTAGVDATITLTPCPRGVNWNNTSHNLEIIDAVGGNEDVLIKSVGPGNCTSGAATGTITITNIGLNHTSGNWTIGPAANGITEAIQTLLPVTSQFEALGAGGGVVLIPKGTHSIYGATGITLPGNITLEGEGEGTILTGTAASQTIITTVPYSTRSQVKNLTINRGAFNGVIGLDLNSVTEGRYENLKILNGNGGGGGSVGVRFRTTSNGVPADPGDINAYNVVKHISIINGDTGILMDGDASFPAPQTGGHVTSNRVTDVLMNLPGSKCIDIAKNADTNFFHQITCGFAGGGGTWGVIFNSASAAAEQYVENNWITESHIDGGAGSTCVKFNYTTGNWVQFRTSSTCTPWTQTADTTDTVVESNSLSATNMLMVPNGKAVVSHTAAGAIFNVLKPQTSVLYVGDTGKQITLQGPVTTTAALSLGDVLKLKSYTAAEIGACGAGQKGYMFHVTDSTVNRFGAAIGGGGTYDVGAYCTGAAWVVFAAVPNNAVYQADGQSVSVGSANLIAAAPAGTYQVNSYIHTTTVAGGVCTAAVVVGYTYNGGAKTRTLTAAHDLNTDEAESDTVGTIRVDAGTNITRAITVGGGGCGGAQRWDVSIVAQRIN